MSETYDKITICQGSSSGISEMGKAIGPEEREANPGNGVTAGISGEPVTSPERVPDLGMQNTGFNNYDKPGIQVGRKSILLKIDVVRK